jgi:hypothetical protein
MRMQYLVFSSQAARHRSCSAASFRFRCSSSVRFRSSYTLEEAAQDAKIEFPSSGHSVRVRVLLRESEDRVWKINNWAFNCRGNVHVHPFWIVTPLLAKIPFIFFWNE